MEKKAIIDGKWSPYNATIVESYKSIDKPNSPIIGSFVAKDAIVADKISINRTLYPSRLWETKKTFAKGGKFIDENGKLRPATLLGSLDHPTIEAPEMRLETAAVAYRDIVRKPDGTFDLYADILDTPSGRIVKTMLEYAKAVGGGDMFGNSIRGSGRAISKTYLNEAYSEIDPESYELHSIDFVYNPSFSNKAVLTESVGSKTLTESIKALGDTDTEHKAFYEAYVDKIKNDMSQVDEHMEGNKKTMGKLRKTNINIKQEQLDDAIRFLEGELQYLEENNLLNTRHENTEYHISDQLSGPRGYDEDFGELLLNMWLAIPGDNTDDAIMQMINQLLALKEADEPEDITDVFEASSVETARNKYIVELKDEALRLHKLINELEKMSEEEFSKAYPDKPYEAVLNKLKEELSAVNKEVEAMSNPTIAEASKELEKEINNIEIDEELQATDEEVLEEELEKAEDEKAEDEKAEDEAEEDVDTEEDSAEEELEDLEDTEEEKETGTIEAVNELKGLIEKLAEELAEIKELMLPILSPEDVDLDIDIEDLEDNEEDPEDDEEFDLEDDEEFDLSSLSDEELEALAEEELEYLSKNK